MCLSVCLRPPFLDDRRSDLIETCQEYCRGPADVPFRGLISIGRAVPKLRLFICRPMTRHGAMTSRMTSQLMFIYLFLNDWRHNSSSSSFDMTSQLTLGTWVCAFSRFDIILLHPFQLFPMCFPSYGNLWYGWSDLIETMPQSSHRLRERRNEAAPTGTHLRARTSISEWEK